MSNRQIETVDAEIMDSEQNNAKQTKTVQSSVNETESISEYFDELIPKAKPIVMDTAPLQEGNSSSFADFEEFSDQSKENENSIEVYEAADDGDSEVLCSTGDLAKMFNVSNQTIRNTENYFIEILSDERGADGRKLYTRDDIAIIKQIFHMMNVQKYKRFEIRDYMLQHGISAKNKDSKFTTEINLEGLPKSNAPKAAPEQNALLQTKFNEAMLSFQTSLSEKVSEGFSLLQKNLNDNIKLELQNNAKHIDDKLSKTADDLKKIIEEQKKVIETQKDEIIKLKSTIININHTALEIDKGVKAIKENPGLTEKELNSITESINTVIKESTSSDSIDNLQNSVKELKSVSQNNAKQLNDEIAKQSKTLNDITKDIAQIVQNSANDKQNNVKAELADSLNRNYQKIEKALSNSSEANNKLIDDKLTEIKGMLDGAISNPSSIDDETVAKLNTELELALDKIEDLKKQNESLEKEKTNNATIITMQSETITSLKEQIDQNSANQGASNSVNQAQEQKLQVAKVLTDKLLAENQELKNKVEISNMIIKKQDETIRSYESKASLNITATQQDAQTSVDSGNSGDDDSLDALLS